MHVSIHWHTDGPNMVPLSLAQFTHDIQAIRRHAERDHANIVSREVYDRGTAAPPSSDGWFMAVPRLGTECGGHTVEVAAKLVPGLSIGVHDPTLVFTNAFFHTAAQLQQEVAEAGFADVRVLGIEGSGVDHRRRARRRRRRAARQRTRCAPVDRELRRDGGRRRPPNGPRDGSLASKARSETVVNRRCRTC
jgi:hypothetical protein